MEDKWLELLKQGKCITERDVKILCEKVWMFFLKQKLKKFICSINNYFIICHQKFKLLYFQTTIKKV